MYWKLAKSVSHPVYDDLHLFSLALIVVGIVLASSVDVMNASFGQLLQRHNHLQCPDSAHLRLVR